MACKVSESLGIPSPPSSGDNLGDNMETEIAVSIFTIQFHYDLEETVDFHFSYGQIVRCRSLCLCKER